jgi:YbgC/YbaW family acyl-CoA thioester hydrolase
MTRVKLELPKEFNFSTDIQVRRSDINAGNHVGADTLLRYTTEAMVIFLRKIGFSESDRRESGLIMTDATLVFKSQAFYGEIVRIEAAVTDFTRKSCSFYYLLTNGETGREIAHVKTNMVFFDYKTQKTIDVPAKFRDSF